MVLSCMVWIGRGPPETVQAEGNSGRVRAVDRDLVGKARGPGRVHTVIGVGSEKFWGLLERGARNSGGRRWRKPNTPLPSVTPLDDPQHAYHAVAAALEMGGGGRGVPRR